MAKVKLTADLIEGFQTAYLKAHYDDPKPTPQCHREWWEWFCSPKRFGALAAPRGHAKSTAITHAATLASICFRTHRHILIVSDTEKQASSFLINLKTELMENEDLRTDFQVGEIIKDSETEFVFRFKDKHWVRLIAKGSGQKLRGMTYLNSRPDLVVGDDMENDELVENKNRRDKFTNWFLKALIPAISKRGKVRVVGTILHFDGLLERLLNMKVFYGLRYEAHDDNFENILWPEEWPLQRLQELYEVFMGDNNPEGYAQEMRNMPIDKSTAFFQLKYITPYEVLPRGCTYYVGVDLAISQQNKRDWSVFAVVAVDSAGRFYLVNVLRERMGPDKIMDTFFEIQQVYQPVEFIVENGQIWRAIEPMLETEQVKRGIYLSFPDEKMVPIQDKEVRAKPMQARIKMATLMFNTKPEWWKDVLGELTTFPAGKHDDIVDAIAWVCLRMHRVAAGRTEEEIEEEKWDEEYGDEGFNFQRDSMTGY